jgi:GNAT superfamily N-acetyltransferase
VFRRWPEFQFLLVDSETEEVYAAGNCAPLAWAGDEGSLPDEGWDWMLHQAQLDFEAGRAPETLGALSVSVATEHQGRGLSGRMIQTMMRLAEEHGLRRLIAPVRPSAKQHYPLIPMEHYARWQTEDGLPFDPWLRVHVRVGGRIVGACERAMCISGPVEGWERWLHRPLPYSGLYVGPGLLTPLRVDREAGVAFYEEPGVWVVHEVG